MEITIPFQGKIPILFSWLLAVLIRSTILLWFMEKDLVVRAEVAVAGVAELLALAEPYL